VSERTAELSVGVAWGDTSSRADPLAEYTVIWLGRASSRPMAGS
jgi:hypothetical protein